MHLVWSTAYSNTTFKRSTTMFPGSFKPSFLEEGGGEDPGIEVDVQKDTEFRRITARSVVVILYPLASLQSRT